MADFCEGQPVDTNLHKLSHAALARLLKIESFEAPSWEPTDLAEILRHQLDIPLIRGIKPLSPAELTQIANLCRSVRPPIGSLRDLLEHANPPLPLLESVKSFARQCRDRTDQALAPEVATALYFACIAQALNCHRQRITTLDDAGLRQGLGWLEEQAWAGDALRASARDAKRLCKGHAHN